MTLDPKAEGSAPVYPPLDYSARRSGRIKVELSFFDPAERPRVQVLEREGDDDRRFEASVRDFVQHLRAPCMAEGPVPARLTIDYVFNRDRSPGLNGQPVDADAELRRQLFHCIRHVSGESKPAFPERASKAGELGRVLVEMRFIGPDSAPDVQVHGHTSTRELQKGVRGWTAGLRLPCFDGQPLVHRVTYVFIYQDMAIGFKGGVSFQQIFGSVRADQRALIPADSTAMACPFNLRFAYYRPRDNLVHQIHSYDPRRTPLLEWLRKAEFDLNPDLLNAVWGDAVEFEVPCYRMAGAATQRP
ncbi:MAG: hypothetical protein ACKVQR_17555 [Aquabacterium sp.]